VTVADVKEGKVRKWRKKLLDSGVGPVTVAKAYRLLKAIMNTAVDDGLIKRNPCRIDGAGQEHSPERPVLTVAQVFALTDAFTDRRYRLLILLAVFCSLRWGELAALTRDAIDLDHGVVSVRVGVVELARGPLVTGPPKSPAGKRDVTIPAILLPDVSGHLEAFTAPKPHTGNQMAADEGASLRELMERMGHSSARAALIYQHRSMQRDKAIADAMGKRAQAELKRSGTKRARGKKKRS
jgi:integrase